MAYSVILKKTTKIVSNSLLVRKKANNNCIQFVVTQRLFVLRDDLHCT